MVFRKFIYGDPSNLVDALRNVEKKTDNCKKCRFNAGMIFDLRLCDIEKKPDEDGYCEHWRENVSEKKRG